MLLRLSDPRQVKKATCSRNWPVGPCSRSVNLLWFEAPESSYPGQRKLASHQPFPSQVPIMQCLPGPGLRAKSAPSSLARTGLAGQHCRSGCRRWRGWTRGFWSTGEGSGQRLPGTRHGMKGRADRAAERSGGRSGGWGTPRWGPPLGVFMSWAPHSSSV